MAPANASGARLWRAAALAGLLSLPWLLYAGVLDAPFVYDDALLSTGRPGQVESLGDVGAILAARGLPRRIGNASFALSRLLSGSSPTGMRAVNVALHGLNGVLLFLLASRLWECTGERATPEGSGTVAAFVASALWLVNPTQTQAVAYIYQRFTCLVTTTSLIALLLFLDALRSSGGRRLWRLALSAAAWMMALGVKENAAILPLLAGATWLLCRRGPRHRPSGRAWLGLATLVTLSLIVAAWYLGSNFVEMIERDSLRRGFTPWRRVMTEWRVVWYYLGLFAWPHPSRLVLDYDWRLSTGLMTPTTTLLSLVGIIGLLALAWRIARSRPLESLAIVWYLGGLAIESSFIPLDLVYEHRLYLPSMLPTVAAVFLAARSGLNRRTLLVAAALLGVTWSSWTLERNRVWESPVALFEDNAAKAPARARVRANLANAYLAEGRLADAEREFEMALGLDPDIRGPRTNLAALALERGPAGFERARQLLSEEISRHPAYAPARTNMGALHIRQRDFAGAIPPLRRALELDPGSDVASESLGLALINTGRASEAVPVLEASLAMASSARKRALLGVALFETGRVEAARRELLEALRVDPEEPIARGYLSRALAERRAEE